MVFDIAPIETQVTTGVWCLPYRNTAKLLVFGVAPIETQKLMVFGIAPVETQQN